MTCIVEAVFLRANSKFILKEICYYVVETGENEIFTLKPPHPWEELSYVDKRLCSWISSNICELKWGDGELEYSKLKDLATTISGKGKTFYTKGLEKANFLTDFLDVPVINLEDFHCPKLTDLTDLTNSISIACKYHSNKSNCALFKAYKLSLFVKNGFQVVSNKDF